MTQYWRDLLFLHWRFDARAIQEKLPPGLSVETFDGDAWIGIVPFQMENIRILGCPMPGSMGAFPELNLRTYVHDESGRSGVWFFSLDAGNRFAVWGARTFFHLNYQNAVMDVREKNERILFTSRRRNAAVDQPGDCFSWKPQRKNLSTAAPDSLEAFFLERYHLFSNRCGTDKLFYGSISHEPYRFATIHDFEWTTHLFALNDFTPPSRPPDSALVAPGFPVKIRGLERIPASN